MQTARGLRRKIKGFVWCGLWRDSAHRWGGCTLMCAVANEIEDDGINSIRTILKITKKHVSANKYFTSRVIKNRLDKHVIHQKKPLSSYVCLNIEYPIQIALSPSQKKQPIPIKKKQRISHSVIHWANKSTKIKMYTWKHQRPKFTAHRSRLVQKKVKKKKEAKSEKPGSNKINKGATRCDVVARGEPNPDRAQSQYLKIVNNFAALFGVPSLEGPDAEQHVGVEGCHKTRKISWKSPFVCVLWGVIWRNLDRLKKTKIFSIDWHFTKVNQDCWKGVVLLIKELFFWINY